MDQSKFIPTIKIDFNSLPSKGSTYPKHASISYRGYLFGELQEINGSKGRTFVDSMRDAMSGISVTGMSVEDITLPDAVYLAILRRMSSCGTSEFEIKYSCRKCSSLEAHIFSQTNISFNDLAIDGVGVGFELSNGKKYELSPMTYGDFLQLATGVRGSRLGKKELLRDKTAVLAIMCRNLRFDEVYEDFYNLTNPEDIDTIKEANLALHHDLKPLDATCRKCGQQNAVVLEGRDSLIRPFRAGGSADRKRIHTIKRAQPQSLSHEDDGV